MRLALRQKLSKKSRIAIPTCSLLSIAAASIFQHNYISTYAFVFQESLLHNNFNN